jgi:hypothetical protein
MIKSGMQNRKIDPIEALLLAVEVMLLSRNVMLLGGKS